MSHAAAAWFLIVLLPLTLLGIWNLVQPQHTLMRNYPIIAHCRWIFEELRPYLRQYIVEGDLERNPYNLDERLVIYARAKDQEDAHPFGTELDVYSQQYEWLTHSMAPRPKAEEPFRVDVGGPHCKRPYSASLLNISAMSFGSLGATSIEVLNLGAAKGGFYHDTGEGAVSRYHTIHGGDLVWEIGSGYFGCRNEGGSFDAGAFEEQASIDQIRMIEIKLSQGAKPGHGGMLPGEKVTEEIAEARRVPAGTDCISPAYHTAFSTPRELLAFAAKLRDLAGGKPVGIKLCVGQPHELFAIMKAMLEDGALLDFIVIDDKAPRVRRFHETTMTTLTEIVAAAGCDSPAELRPHHLHHRLSAVETRAIDRIYPFLEENELVDAPGDTPYADWWRAADPDSFDIRHDVMQARRARSRKSDKLDDVL